MRFEPVDEGADDDSDSRQHRSDDYGPATEGERRHGRKLHQPAEAQPPFRLAQGRVLLPLRAWAEQPTLADRLIFWLRATCAALALVLVVLQIDVGTLLRTLGSVPLTLFGLWLPLSSLRAKQQPPYPAAAARPIAISTHLSKLAAGDPKMHPRDRGVRPVSALRPTSWCPRKCPRFLHRRQLKKGAEQILLEGPQGRTLVGTTALADGR